MVVKLQPSENLSSLYEVYVCLTSQEAIVKIQQLLSDSRIHNPVTQVVYVGVHVV